jgi:NADH:ubiquinone oxidoreductase subunit F (NADH-binding)
MNQAIGIQLLLGPRPITSLEEYLAGGAANQVVEGLAIAALAVDAREAFISLKANFRREQEATERAIGQMQESA